MNDIDAFEFHEAFSVSHWKDTYQRIVTIKNVVCVCVGDPGVAYDVSETPGELYIWSTDLHCWKRHKGRESSGTVWKPTFWGDLLEALGK